MKKVSSRKKLLKDAAILLTLTALLLALPWTQDLLRRDEGGSSIEQIPAPTIVERDSEIPVRNPVQLAEEREFIAEVFPKISSWQLTTLEPYLAEDMKSGEWQPEIDSVLTILSERLGSLQSHADPEAIATLPPNEKGEIVSVYEFIAQYANGSADVNLMLTELEGSPKLYSFNINVHSDQPLL